MRCEVVAVGTELLLGQIVDTNSSWLGEQLAAAGIDSHFQVKVGDNLARIVQAIRTALSRSEAVIVCGGLGPTQDDITREAIAEVMNVPLERDEAMVDTIRAMFEARGRAMSENNARQADVPRGATVIPQTRGTAPGLVCPVGKKVVYAVPGVPYEMQDMWERAVLPDLQARAGTQATIVSRVLRTWGLAESTLAETVAPRLEALDAAGNPTIAFLAGGMEGIKVRITAKAATREEAEALLAAEEAEVRALLGPVVFGIDDETMESAVGALLVREGLTLGVAESVTGGLIASRIVNVPGASEWFRGGVVSYATEVKRDLLGVPEGPVVSERAARAMAEGACKVLGSDVGLSITGVAGPTEQDGQRPGTVFIGLRLDGFTDVVSVRLPGDRDRVRQYAAISALEVLRRRLLDRSGG
ncbi:MAG TPA: competence/damage-inducible protein A [Acidimicrobiales bacterium]|nr:competence/damage-inducible protein A [Acidimicrobiales bacterium]